LDAAFAAPRIVVVESFMQRRNAQRSKPNQLDWFRREAAIAGRGCGARQLGKPVD
jgi:hypothetical protein